MRKDIPSHIIIFEYPGKMIEGKEDMQKCTRYAYVYPGEDLNEKMRQGWKTEGKAQVFKLTYKREANVKPSAVKGVWE